MLEEWEGESSRRAAGWEFRRERGGAGGEGRSGSHVYCLPEVLAIPTGGWSLAGRQRVGLEHCSLAVIMDRGHLAVNG